MICKICGKEFDKRSYCSPYEDICCSECFHINFWNDKVESVRTEPRQVVINGEVYWIGDEDQHPFEFRGFTGLKFKIKRRDTGEVFETTNLWYNGKVPEEYKDKIKDNADFITE